MGKGDLKSRRGKLFAKTYGVRRQKRKKTRSAGAVTVAEAAPTVKAKGRQNNSPAK